MKEIKIGGIYQHFKNKHFYKVICVAKDCDDLEDLVIYESQYADALSKFWVRPLGNFLEQVEVGGQLVDRFTLQNDEADND
ncbi:MAG: DUF1653 domain-containing protein [Pseudomonadales bacterium]|jgi:hypothetical protein|nr:DUF1653 domain-containing protein [Pseudomonadales bacterium]